MLEPPAIVDGTVYVGSHGNHVSALDAADGVEQWRFQTGGAVHTAPAVVDGTVYLASLDGNIYALATQNGSEQWHIQSDKRWSSPTVVDGTVYLGSSDNNVHAMTDQTQLSTSTPTETATSTPTETIAAGQDSGQDEMEILPIAIGVLGLGGLGGAGAWWVARNGGDSDGSGPTDEGSTGGTGGPPSRASTSSSGSAGGQTKSYDPESSIQNSTATSGGSSTPSTSTTESSTDSNIPATVNDSRNAGEGLREQARNYRDTGKYDQALETYDKARAAYENAREAASENDLDTDKIDQKLTAVKDGRREVRQMQLQNEVESIHSDLDRADTLADEGDLEAVRELLRTLEPQFESLREAAAQLDFDDIHDEVVELEQQHQGRLANATEKKDQREQLEDEVETVRSTINQASTRAEDGEFKNARETLADLDSRLESLQETAAHRSFDELREEILLLEQQRENELSELTKLKEQYVDLQSEIDLIRSKFNRVDTLSDEGEFESAEEVLTDLKSRLDVANETAVQYGLNDLQKEVTALGKQCKNRQEEVAEKKQVREQRNQLTADIETLRSELDDIGSLIRKIEFEEAQERLAELETRLTSTKETATEYGFDTLREEITNLAERQEDKFTEVTEKKKQHEELRDEIASIQTELDRATKLVDEGGVEDAKGALTDLEPRLNSVETAAAQYDFDDLHGEIVALEQRRQNRLTGVVERLGAQPVPNVIPTAPDVSVDYEAIIDEQPIAGGGSADVTRARLPTSEGEVTLAIKKPRMTGTLHTDAVERILEEAEMWDKLDDHDHVVGVVDWGVHRGIPWIAMEYMDGGHLGDRAGSLSVDQTLWTAIAVTKAVHYAHYRRGVAHLDLKPANVLFRTVEGGWDVPKVGDWGLSRHLINQSKSIQGLTPEHAAPEQFSEEYGSADSLTDVYQLGATFYTLFVGSPPFSGSPAEVMRSVLDEAPTPPSEIADVPETLDEILLTALAKEKADRYESVLYIRDALREVYDDF